MKNILDYADNLVVSIPKKIQLTKSTVLKIEEALKDILEMDESWAEHKTNGLLNNYRGIPIEIKEER
jgi:hypothetical protein